MVSYPLQIVSPDGLIYDGEAVFAQIRTIAGDIGIRARHANLSTALGMGMCRIDTDENVSRYAACIGGLLAVMNGSVRIVATTFEWADEIDVERAKAAKIKAGKVINSDIGENEKKTAKSRLGRAELRLYVAERR